MQKLRDGNVSSPENGSHQAEAFVGLWRESVSPNRLSAIARGPDIMKSKGFKLQRAYPISASVHEMQKVGIYRGFGIAASCSVNQPMFSLDTSLVVCSGS